MNKVQQDQEVSLGVLDHKVHRDSKVELDQLDHLAHLLQEVSKVNKDLLEKQGLLDLEASLVHLALGENQVGQVREDPQENQEAKVKGGPRVQEGNKGRLDQVDQQVNVVNQVPRVQEVKLAALVHLDSVENQVSNAKWLQAMVEFLGINLP